MPDTLRMTNAEATSHQLDLAERAVMAGIPVHMPDLDDPNRLFRTTTKGTKMPDATIDKSIFLSSQTVEWPTPQYLFDQLDREFHFTVDVAANPTNAKCPKFYTVDDDGISQDWDGETVWCNPPYGEQLKHWVWKAAHSAATTVMLVPARTDVKWFHDYVIPTAEVRFIKGRLKFGDATTPAPFPTMLCIWRNAEPTD